MPQPAYTRTAIVQMLKDLGPMSAADITREMGIGRKAIGAAINSARSKFGTALIRIERYDKTRGRGGREVPIYGPGPGADVKRPTFGKHTVRQAQKRYDDRNRELLRLRTKARRGTLNHWVVLLGDERFARGG
jgi:hypothetical protein